MKILGSIRMFNNKPQQLFELVICQVISYDHVKEGKYSQSGTESMCVSLPWCTAHPGLPGDLLKLGWFLMRQALISQSSAQTSPWVRLQAEKLVTCTKTRPVKQVSESLVRVRPWGTVIGMVIGMVMEDGHGGWSWGMVIGDGRRGWS